MRLEDPGRSEVQRADKACVVRVVTDRQLFDLEVLGLEDDFGACDSEFAEAAVAKAAAHHDTFCLLPGLGLEELARDVGELLREIPDGAVHDCRGLGVLANQDGIEDLLADVFGRFRAKWVVPRFTQRLPPLFEDVPEGALAGAVPQKSFFVLQFDVEAVHLYRR